MLVGAIENLVMVSVQTVKVRIQGVTKAVKTALWATPVLGDPDSGRFRASVAMNSYSIRIHLETLGSYLDEYNYIHTFTHPILVYAYGMLFKKYGLLHPGSWQSKVGAVLDCIDMESSLVIFFHDIDVPKSLSTHCICCGIEILYKRGQNDNGAPGCGCVFVDWPQINNGANTTLAEVIIVLALGRRGTNHFTLTVRKSDDQQTNYDSDPRDIYRAFTTLANVWHADVIRFARSTERSATGNPITTSIIEVIGCCENVGAEITRDILFKALNDLEHQDPLSMLASVAVTTLRCVNFDPTAVTRLPVPTRLRDQLTAAADHYTWHQGGKFI
jgi:hypothetical protein